MIHMRDGLLIEYDMITFDKKPLFVIIIVYPYHFKILHHVRVPLCYGCLVVLLLKTCFENNPT